MRFSPNVFVARIPRSRAAPRFKRFAIKALPIGTPVQSLYVNAGRVIVSTAKAFHAATLKTSGRLAVTGWEKLPGPGASSFTALFAPGEGRIGARTMQRPPRHAKMPAKMRALYVSPTTARRKQWKLFRLLKKYPYNAAVIDVKDDFGRLVYGSKLPEARAMGNHRRLVPIRKLLPKLKKRGIYLIARIVVFKDKRLYRYKRNRYAIRDRYTRRPWAHVAQSKADKEAGRPGRVREHWVDSYSSFVHDYNIRVAREALALGFDEIQFDYIRFPSDGPVHRCAWPHQTKGAYKSEALEAFLRKARLNISAPISVDIYGYNGMYRISGRVGQDLVDMGDYVDVVSPMHYSSHFGPRYLEGVPRKRRTYTLIKMGVARPLQMGYGRFSVRPWLQCFKMNYGRWGWGEWYMKAQIDGARDGGASGLLWWGPLRLFYMPGRVHARDKAAALR